MKCECGSDMALENGEWICSNEKCEYNLPASNSSKKGLARLRIINTLIRMPETLTLDQLGRIENIINE
jgi:hypothetical protein